MDKIFGNESFLNEIVWTYTSGGVGRRWFGRKHDILLLYSKEIRSNFFSLPVEKSYTKTLPEPHTKSGQDLGVYRDDICELCKIGRPGQKYRLVSMRDVWTDLRGLFRNDAEIIGYPTQKPERLLERVITSCSPEGGVVADFFCGGGTTSAVAQRLGRRWITCDQSRVAVAVTADRLTRQVGQTGKVFPVPDFTVENWGIYEAQRLAQAPLDQFQAFVLRCFRARIEQQDEGIHGYKGSVPVWVGIPDINTAVTEADVQNFANAIRKTLRYRQDNLRDGFMIAWAFEPGAGEAAGKLRALEQTDVNFIRLEQVRIDSPRFREHVAALSTDHADYEHFPTFIQPPRVEVGYKPVSPLTYVFDVSDTAVMNPGAKIINIQWDFNHEQRFSSTEGYSFMGNRTQGPQLQAEFEFPKPGKRRIACRVQDDLGGDGIRIVEIEVS